MSKLISVCMIVKNEEEVLGRCLDAIDGLHDELIIVDTGSTDRTIEIAESYGAKVLHYEWIAPGHLGEARNVGLDAATGEWVFVIDADEILTGAKDVRHWVENIPDEAITAVSQKFKNYDAAGNVEIEWWQPRLWRRGLYRYVHRAHEVPVETVDSKKLKQVAIDTIIEHRPKAGDSTGKAQNLLAMLELDISERPDDSHSTYFLHRQYALLERWDDCIKMGRRYLALNKGVDNYDCLGTLATAYTHLGQWQEAVDCLHLAMSTQAHRRIWWVRLAEMYMGRGQWNIALSFLRGAAELLPVFEWTNEVKNTGAGLYELIAKCQHNIAHDLAHSHSH